MDFSKFVYAYAISGGIGSGKSSVCRILSSLDYDVIDADKIAHQVLEQKSLEVIDEFGYEIVSEGKINRKALGSIVFADKERLRVLQNILNPSIYEEIFVQCQKLEAKSKPYFVEIALLFEQKEIFNFKHKVLIVAPQGEVIKRVQNRDGLSEEAILQRINAQASVEQKSALATEIIYNDLDFSALRSKIEKWVSRLG